MGTPSESTAFAIREVKRIKDQDWGHIGEHERRFWGVRKDVSSTTKLRVDHRNSKVETQPLTTWGSNFQLQAFSATLGGRGQCFSAAPLLQYRSRKEIRNGIQHMWSLVYFVHPDLSVVDQGTAYNSNEMKDTFKHVGCNWIGHPSKQARHMELLRGITPHWSWHTST